MKKLAVMLLMLCISIDASAIVTVTGKIARIFPIDQVIYFNLKGDVCGKGPEVYYSFKLDTEVKKAAYSLLLASATSDKTIVVSLPNCPGADNAAVEIRYLYQDF